MWEGSLPPRARRRRRWKRPGFVVLGGIVVGLGVWVGTGYFRDRQIWGHYQQQVAFKAELEPAYRVMREGILTILAGQKPYIVREGSADPTMGTRGPPMGSWVLHAKAGTFGDVYFGVLRNESTPAGFTLSMWFKPGDGRLEMNTEEMATFVRIARNFGFKSDDQQKSLVRAMAEARGEVSSTRPNAKRTVMAGEVAFLCQAFDGGTTRLQFAGPVTDSIVKAFKAPPR